MIGRILALSIQHRWVVVLASLGAIALGIWSLARLPVDAVPDITNKQVQVNTTAFALSPAEIEKQVGWKPMLNAPPTCARCKIGSCVRRSRACLASPE